MNQFDPIYFTEPCGTCYKGFKSGSLYKGGKAPKPDPQIGRAALETAAIGRDAFEFYKQEFINNKPSQDRLNTLNEKVQEQLIESGRLSNEDAADYREYNKTVFRPLEKSIVNDANEYDTAGRREAEAAKGLSDVTQSFDTRREITMRNNERVGINPNSGNSQALGQQLDVQEAIAGANAVNAGRTNAEMRGKALKIDAASLGRNLPSNQATSQQIANASATGAINVGLAGAQNQRAGADVYGKGAGLAIQGVGKSGDILNQQYNNQLQAWQANQSRNDSAWGNIGSAVGIGASIFGGLKDGGSADRAALGLDAAMPATIDNDTGEVFNGKVTGAGTETSDSIPARLSKGEYVLNAGAVRMVGLETLDKINSRGLKFRKDGK